jgi:MFS-type transporter involved in bile tolerance (Atg22 family)
VIICAGFGLIFGGIPATITLYFVQNASLADYGPSFAAGTLAFGIGQMISPQIGGVIADVTGSFTLVISLSAVVAVTGVIFALCLPKQDQPKLLTQLPAFAQPVVYRVTASSK